MIDKVRIIGRVPDKFLSKEGIMRNVMASVVVFCILAVCGGCATTQPKGLADMVAEGCKADIDTHCKGVAPGEGRMLACLYAYSDQLSERCEYALYNAASQLEWAVQSLAYAASECRNDLQTYCSDVNPGEGRLIQCLDKNKNKISDRCKQAKKDIGL